jgi:glycerol transport system ATP-binding protein
MGIILEGVTKSFQGRTVLDAISLEVNDGDFVSLLAPTGEGKTTLLRIMAGVEKPDRGRVFYDGEDVTDTPVQKRNIAMVYQWFVNYPSMTVYDNVALPLRAARRRLADPEIDAKVRQTAKLLKIDHVLDHLPAELSGGQQQRLAIARALVKDARYVFLDEPLTNLDYKLQEELRSELKDLFRRRGAGAVVFATPQPVEALSLSTHVGFLSRGKLLQYGETRDVYENPRHREVASYFSHPSMNLFPCSVSEDAGGLWLAATDELKVRADGLRTVLDGHDYVLGIRAQSLSTARSGPDDIRVAATVELSEVVGSDTELHLNHRGIPIVALMQGMGKYEIGSEVAAFLHPNRFFIFEAKSGRIVGKA